MQAEKYAQITEKECFMHNVEFFPTAIKENYLLTVIIILRAVKHYDMIDRIRYRLVDGESKEHVKFLVVDDGSDRDVSEEIKDLCLLNEIDFIHINSENKPFSPGRARNVGAAFSRTQFIIHEDVDLYPVKGYYKELTALLLQSHLLSNNDDFLSVPVLYLNENGSADFFATNESLRKKKFIDMLNEGDSSAFEFFMPASSVILVNRNYYLSIGGYNEEFINWGLEDLEYAYRLTRMARRFHSPRNLRRLVTNPPFSKQTAYYGWRAQFRLHGGLCLQNSLFLFHIHHPKDNKWRDKTTHEKNKKLWDRCIELFEESGHYLLPIADPWKGRTLMFGKGCFCYNRTMLPYWGNVKIKGYEFFAQKDILEYVEENSISRVVFTNPYANAARKLVYDKVRHSDVPFYVVERGALRDSMFVDKTGFCCESTLYSEKFWDKELTQEQQDNVLDYISKETISSISLEKQNNRIGVQMLRKKLGIANFEKVVFVPLQSRSDTTINFFAGQIGNYDNFLELVKNVTIKVPSNWVVVVKQHPLSKVDENIPGVIFANDTNINDLLELSDYVLLMNSGVGVLATLWFKPVIYTAKAFYASEKLNRSAITADDVINIIQSNFTPRIEDCIKFIHYLINEFYSFGTMTVQEKGYTEDANLTITTDIDYYQLNIDGQRLFEKNPLKKPVSFDSPFYDIFRQDIVSHITSKKKLEKTPVSQGKANKIYKKWLKFKTYRQFFSKKKFR